MNKILESWLYKELLDQYRGDTTLKIRKKWGEPAELQISVVRKGNDRMLVAIDHLRRSINIIFEESSIKEIKDWFGRFGNFTATFTHRGIHRGWNNTYCKKFKTSVDTFVTSHPEYDIHVIGHSRGGALAGVCLYYLGLEHEGHDLSGITYGSPRFTDKQGRDAFNRMPIDFLRVIYDADPVTRLPYKIMGGARHVGRTKIIGKLKFRYAFPITRRVIGFKRHVNYGKKIKQLFKYKGAS